MSRRLRHVLRSLCICAPLLGLMQLALGQTFPHTARAFAGFYYLSDVINEGDVVHLTMTLSLINFAKRDVNGRSVALLDTSPSPVLLGSFDAIKSPSLSQYLTIKKAFTIPAAEFARWQTGHEPVMEFLVPAQGSPTFEADGIQVHRVLEPAGPLN